MRGLLACCFALGALLASAAASAAVPPRAVESGGARFPERAFVVTLPTRRTLRAAQVRVTENGEGVRGLTVVPISSLTGGSAVVLVIDTSNSMAGAPIRDALRAARAFAVKRAGTQRLAIVTFDRTSRVLLRFTTDAAAIGAALTARPALAEGTHVYDGVRRAAQLIRAAAVGPAAIVVLSDGADTGSKASAADVDRAANAAGARIFSVGLRSREFAAGPLRRMADSTGGAYTEASSSAQLTGIYDALSARFASEHIVRYRSLAGDDTRVRVRIEVDGLPGVATAGYRTPALPRTVAAPFERSVVQRVWASGLTMLLIALAVAALLAAGAVRVVRPRGRTVVDRLSQFVSLVGPATAARRKGGGTPITETVFTNAERSLARTSWWPRFKDELEIAEVKTPAVQIALWTLVGTLFAMWLLNAAVGPLAALLGLAVPLVVRGFMKRKLDRKRRLFGDQLPDNLQVLASALRAGHSLVGALSVVIDDAPEPSRTEFQRVIADEQLGVPLEDALEVVVRRMDNQDLEQVALVAALQRQTGANSAEVLDRVTENVRESQALRRLVRSLTAQGRMSRWVVSFLPVALLLIITLLNPGYIEPLYTNTVGRAMLVVAAIMVVSGSLVIRKIVDIKV